MCVHTYTHTHVHMHTHTQKESTLNAASPQKKKMKVLGGGTLGRRSNIEGSPMNRISVLIKEAQRDLSSSLPVTTQQEGP